MKSPLPTSSATQNIRSDSPRRYVHGWENGRAFVFRAMFSFAALSSLLVVALGSFPGWVDWWRFFGRHRSLGDSCPFEQPDLSVPLFHATRPRLFASLARSFNGSVPHSIILPAAHHVLHAESDAEYMYWKQTANLKYLMDSYPIDGGVVVLNSKLEGYEIVVYLPEQNDRDIAFLGPLPSKEYIIKEYHVQNVFSIVDLPDHLSVKAKTNVEILTTVESVDLYNSLPANVVEKLARIDVAVAFSDVALQAFYQARFVKTKEELTRLVFASHLASWVHKRVEKYIAFSKEVNEIWLHTEFVRLSALCGGDIQSYEPIIGAGPNAATLHYRTGFNRAISHVPVKDETFVLIDAAPEFAGYTSDLTRTYARSRKWTKEMEEVFGIVNRVQTKFIHEYYNLGADWMTINQLSKVDLTNELVEAEFIFGSVEEALANNVAFIFMPHGLGHPVGLEVHDPTPSNFVRPLEQSGFAPPTELADYLLQTEKFHLAPYNVASYEVFKGHITTVEPGVYFIPKILEAAKNGPIGKYVNWEKIEHGDYVSLGGVRIEDVILIDHDGSK
ncbi:hypothetical protein HK100_011103, partial [Physocladia obscura]